MYGSLKCQVYVSQLTAHIANLDCRLANESLDYENRLCLRYGSIVSWTNYAHIRYLLASTSSTLASASAPCVPRYFYECNGALQRVTSLIEQLNRCAFLSLEALLGVSSTHETSRASHDSTSPDNLVVRSCGVFRRESQIVPINLCLISRHCGLPPPIPGSHPFQMAARVSRRISLS